MQTGVRGKSDYGRFVFLRVRESVRSPRQPRMYPTPNELKDCPHFLIPMAWAIMLEFMEKRFNLS